MKRRRWTPEEIYFLEDSWGTISIKGIAKKLDRSVNSIKLKAQRIGLDDARLHFDGITVHQLADVLNISYSLIKRWIQIHNFPARKKIFSSEHKVWVVSYQKFWEWAENNKQMIDFSRLERNILGAEPEWVEEKRKADIINNRIIKKSHNIPWSSGEDKKLSALLKSYKYTYPQIAKELRRSESSIKRRIQELGFKQRPVRLNNQVKYTLEEEKKIIEMLYQGYSIDVIADSINKSALGVRGKLERMGYKFRNGVPRLEKEIG
ncbi:hypothetical protein GLV94_05205 [Virgibacillus halodenitrificans]|uniref:hypothetical protein n=1 Tax=Virgibacillus halodenitrificans TaxID=1482 RepID=UPI00136AB4DC|nr:hypothetical protein [Virgibacillus halodenitrificans]MYL45032.1 hypothetical protein [Virgibacillus halodenitrificans]